MRTSTITIALALIATAAPNLAVPLRQASEPSNAIVESDLHSLDARAFDEAYTLQARELEARFKLPVGLLEKLKGPLVKELGKGFLTGGAFAGLAGILGGSSSSQPAQQQQQQQQQRRSFEVEARELEARFELPIGLLEKLKGPLVKELGKGLLTGGAFAGLADLLGGSSTNSAQPTQTQPHRRDFEIEARELEARFKLPAGLLSALKKPLVKELGSGLLTGGAFAGLAGFLGGNGQPTPTPAAQGQPQAREFSEGDFDEIVDLQRRGLSALLTKLIGQEGKLSSIIKNSIFGGIASGTVIGTSQAVAGQNQTKREEELSDEDASVLLALLSTHEKRAIGASVAKFLEGEAGVAIKKGLVNGFGSAVGGLGIGALFDKFEHKNSQQTSKRSEPELTDDDLKLLLSLMSTHDKRGVSAGLAKLFEGEAGVAIKKGLVNGFGSAVGGLGIGALIDKFTHKSAPAPATTPSSAPAKREPLKLNSIGKGLIGTGVGLGASTLAEEAIEEIKKLFNRELMYELEVREPVNLGSIGKGLLGTGVGLAASTLAEDGIEKLEKFFRRELELETLNELD